ncbi:family 16 glycoside hydrolase [Vagococcus fluvialis]|uniref:family 16 glycoside hydrolase n=1 Tax=Vagococcus fluvialis TaxID=2738 RepID=UPI003B2276BF
MSNEILKVIKHNFISNDSFISSEQMDGEEVLRVIKDPIVDKEDEPIFAKIVGHDFHNGTIEVDVYSELLINAPEYARGFIGVTFRIDERNETFEGIYIRPTNGSAPVQLRRNRATQYFSYPDYKYDRLREEAPGEYESYVSIDIDEWIHMKIEVIDDKAKLFVNNTKEPCLIVNDLKHGKNKKGSIGLWTDIGTKGHFKNLRINTTN